jgi:hypothetical protein
VDVYIDCDTCSTRGTGCGDCVVTVLLGAPPGWRGSDPTVVPMTGRREDRLSAEDVVVLPPGVVVEFDEVERRAVQVLADAGLVPPLRHRPATRPAPVRQAAPQRRAGGPAVGRRTG